MREVQALRRLNPHSHIIGLKEIIFDRRVGSLSLVCELSDQNLYELIRGRTRPFDERKISHLVSQLLNALDHTHRAGIYHRDIKPENVLVSQEMRSQKCNCGPLMQNNRHQMISRFFGLLF